LFVVVTLPLVACNKPAIKVYTVAKETTPAPIPPPEMSAPAPGTPTPSTAPNPATAPDAPTPPAPPEFQWSVPAGWQETAPGPMQQARFSVPDVEGTRAEVAVSIFPSDTGGTLANVNRWRAQLGLPSVDERSLGESVAPLATAPGAVLVDLFKDDKRMLAAIVPRDGTWWFYKMTGGTPAVAKAREAFIGFVSSKP
jgi:hypothetical protein